MKKSIQLLILFLLVSTLSFGQEDKCECASYNSLQFRNDFEQLFPPSTIKQANLKEVIVTMNGDSSYREMKYIFNNNGLVISRTWYNRRGIPHSIYEYYRDSNGLIVKQTFSYIDSLERKYENSSPEIIDFEYDSDGRLIKKKERGYRGVIPMDDESSFTTYRYDDKGRKTMENRQYYFEGSIDNKLTQYITNWKYDDSNYVAISETRQRNELIWSTETTYNSNWKPIIEMQINNSVDKHAWQTTYQYNKKKQVIWFSTKSGDGSVSECPEGGTYTESYSYNDSGLVQSVEHIYGETTCKMVFQYKSAANRTYE